MSTKPKAPTTSSSPLRSSSSSSSLGVASSTNTGTILTSRPSATLRTPVNPPTQVGANTVPMSSPVVRKSSLTSTTPSPASSTSTTPTFSQQSATAPAAVKKPAAVPATKAPSAIAAAFMAPGLSAASLIAPQSFAPRLDDRSPAAGVKKIRSSSSRFRTYGSVELAKLPDIMDASLKDRPVLIVEKIRQCTNVFNFMDPAADVRSKDIKRLALTELVYYFQERNQVSSLL